MLKQTKYQKQEFEQNHLSEVEMTLKLDVVNYLICDAETREHDWIDICLLQTLYDYVEWLAVNQGLFNETLKQYS